MAVLNIQGRCLVPPSLVQLAHGITQIVPQGLVAEAKEDGDFLLRLALGDAMRGRLVTRSTPGFGYGSHVAPWVCSISSMASDCAAKGPSV